MSFETDIPKHIAVCEKQIDELRKKRREIDWGDEGHECNCEYCDEQGADATEGEPEAEAKDTALKQEIAEIEHTIKSLKAHAAVHKVRLEAASLSGEHQA